METLDARQLPDLTKEIKTLDQVKKLYVMKALKYHDWNRTRTAKDLGIAIRTLRTMIHKIRGEGWYIP